MKKYNGLVILGNGFDKAHGLKTSYGEFADYLINNHDSKKIANEFKKILAHEGLVDVDDSENWYEFEKQIKKMVPILSNKDVLGDDDSEVRSYMNKVNDLFSDICVYLKEYLQKVTGDSIEIKENIRKYLSGDDIVVNFNYTNTPQLYGCEDNVFLYMDH